MRGIVLGEPLEQQPREAATLVELVFKGTLVAKKKDVQADGDVRYWDVDPEQSPVLRRLLRFGEAQFHRAVGKVPISSLIMVNRTDSKQCPQGSGGGWHRDSLNQQYKAFVYLTDVERPSQGAFSFVPGSNSGLFRMFSLAHRVYTGATRYDDDIVNVFAKVGFPQQAVLLKSGIPFFVDTSLVHRGLPISEGCRMMATVYLFEEIPEWLREYR